MNRSLDHARETLAAFRHLKQHFPFRLGTTSYIYPGEILPNVKMLAECLDEIQILLFEGSSVSNLPDEHTVSALNHIAREKQIAYTVHLPLDAYFGHETETVRSFSVQLILRIYQAGRGFGCTRFVLHYANRTPEGIELHRLRRWKDQSRKSTEELLAAGVEASHLCVENLSYPYAWIADLVEEYGLSRCVDVGHLRINSFPVKAHLRRYLGASKVIHLHGLKNGRDHHGLSRKDAKSMRLLFAEIDRACYRESLILEVFRLDHLVESLTTFQKEWEQWRNRTSF